ncbi:hypothetical protein [Jatrophihabitans lederbergiae]|uniref:AbiEi antitoxin C-terminal domain-containing protein n=1 Tax=Jatrophihabitans lederbergiae TaxID=3075547 RepID=A0ABU2JBC3_9ACTN|nr:hypothetical protein [Jatrophihabitans sp. DSM 44399]MDT0262291.1 hypothetical protein [Jatrophihabitans sp. DSM 44399]
MAAGRDDTAGPGLPRPGRRLVVYAIGEDGPGRRLGSGVVVGHPSPNHVTVESPYGTRRHAPISHVSRPGEPPTTISLTQSPTITAPPDRWREVVTAIDPRVPQDPYWPALVRVLDRIDAQGGDVPALLAQATTDRPLPAEHPARSLDYCLADLAPEPGAAARTRFEAEQHARPVTPPPPPVPAPRRDPGYRPGPRP